MQLSTQEELVPRRIMETLNEQGLYPYHLEKLQPADYAIGVEFCRWISNNDRVVLR